jgi:hypothetical protein
MPDFDVEWQGDFRLTPTGDLATIDGVDLDNQHIERRLLTSVQGYVWHSEFGAGLPQRIGRTALDRGIKAIVRAQLALEATVARVPPPQVLVDFLADQDGRCSIAITYTNAITNTTEQIALEVPTNR